MYGFHLHIVIALSHSQYLLGVIIAWQVVDTMLMIYLFLKKRQQVSHLFR
ncbi:hypothetical protein HMPREF1880_01626 [Streptococcus agalactiae]|nr:glycerophosphoryl diester phosphodiesterase family protein [Streptococcus agalactiae CNCTC 10/84]KXA48330.1 hypothetical protein HMPREF1880_01626 [Streptococcus agalactiae]KXA51858.1 hypothetical protein HMPREF1881_00798 [Streptococcus agalactiae]